MYCGQCGVQIPDGSNFCPECGEAVKNCLNREILPTKKIKTAKIRKKELVIAIIVVLFIVGIVFLGEKVTESKKNIGIFAKIKRGMNSEEIQKVFGEPDVLEDDGDLKYYDVELYGLKGILDIRFGAKGVYWAEWDYHTGNEKTTNDYAEYTQKMYEDFEKKYGEAEKYQEKIFFWYDYGTGGSRYALDFGSYRNVIRMWIDLEP